MTQAPAAVPRHRFEPQDSRGRSRGGDRPFPVIRSGPMDIIIGTVEAFVLAGVLGVASLATAGVLHIG